LHQATAPVRLLQKLARNLNPTISLTTTFASSFRLRSCRYVQFTKNKHRIIDMRDIKQTIHGWLKSTPMFKKCVIFALGACLAAQADTVGLWRFDEVDAALDSPVASSINTNSPGTFDALVAGGNPLYSDDIPAAEIFDPVSGTTYTNQFSLNASAGSSQLSIEDAVDFNSSFTVEFFVKYVGEPGSYEAILQRIQTTDLSWKIDFDHGANSVFGRIRDPLGHPGPEWWTEWPMPSWMKMLILW
jgi:hypothetical protein